MYNVHFFIENSNWVNERLQLYSKTLKLVRAVIGIRFHNSLETKHYKKSIRNRCGDYRCTNIIPVDNNRKGFKFKIIRNSNSNSTTLGITYYVFEAIIGF